MRHLILAAFGTTTRARETYDLLDTRIRPHFPKWHIHWTFSSPTVRKRLQQATGEASYALADLLKAINQDDRNRLVVQSLHVTPGHEFHRMTRSLKDSVIPTAIGMPLLASPDDYRRVSRSLQPLIDNQPQDCVLVLGHGTDHPSWTAYPALQSVLRQQVDTRVFVSTIEHVSDSATLIDKIYAEGHRQVRIIPLLMVAGMHFKRDIIGDNEQSWKHRFEKRNIELTVHDRGIGMLDGISDIFRDHIQAASDTLDQP